MKIFEYLEILLDRADKIIHEEKEKLLSHEDLSKLSYGQFHFIDAISSGDSVTISSLAKELNLTKPTVTVAIQKMEKNGLVYKLQSDRDKRIYFIYLTEKGQRIKKAEQNALRRMEETISRGLSKEDLELLSGLLSKVTGS